MFDSDGARLGYGPNGFYALIFEDRPPRPAEERCPECGRVRYWSPITESYVEHDHREVDDPVARHFVLCDLPDCEGYVWCPDSQDGA